MKNNNKNIHLTPYKLGVKGEDIAIDFLKNKGFSILAINWRYKHKEIDIIAQTANELVIVEVKTRSTKWHQMPYEAVNQQKQNFLIEAANAYILEKDIDMETRFDIISIVFLDKICEIEHIEDAFNPQF